jgi:hypothetical protein
MNDFGCGSMGRWIALALVGFAAGVSVDAWAQSDASLLRWQAPIAIEQPGAFVQLPLSADVYAHSAQYDLADLRIVDARGERVPFALLAAPLSAAATSAALAPPRDVETPAKLYPLPVVAGDPKADGVELNITEGRVSVRTPGGGARSANGTMPGVSPGWLIDLGDQEEANREDADAEAGRNRVQPRPYTLRLIWSGPAEFTAGFSLATSADLRAWRSVASGQVMALASAEGVLTQPLVNLPPGVDRYLRLIWNDASAPPRLSGAQALHRVDAVSAGAPAAPTTEIVVAPMSAKPEVSAAVDFDLGAALPVQQIDLDLGAGTRVAPVRLLVRANTEESWRPLGGAVFYRIEREGVIDRAPALPIAASLRYLRVQPDERAGALDVSTLRLQVRAQLGSLVFASQGQAPYQLRVGSAQVSAGALPLAILVPTLDQQRAYFGRAGLGQWSEVGEVVRREQAEARRAQWRPRLLWGVLLAGVLLLGALVWRLARSGSSMR